MKKKIKDLSYKEALTICHDFQKNSCSNCPIGKLCALRSPVIVFELKTGVLEAEVEVPETLEAQKSALDAMCDRCHKNINSIPSNGDRPFKECPWRGISNDHCPEYEIIKKGLENHD